MELHRIQVDRLCIDIVLADENSESQPYLTVITDHLTGAIVSARVTTSKPSAEENDSDPDL